MIMNPFGFEMEGKQSKDLRYHVYNIWLFKVFDC